MKETNKCDQYDEDYQKFDKMMEEHENKYDAAIIKAIQRAEEDGEWEEIKDNCPKDICIELQTSYPELFEDC